MKLIIPQIDATRIGNTIESIKNALVNPLVQFVNAVRQMFDHNISFEDNINCAVVEFEATSGTEYIFQNPNPKKGIPIGFQLISSMSTTTGQPVTVGSIIPLNTSRTDSLLGVTVNFGAASSASLPAVWVVSRVANQALTTSTDTPVVFDTILNDGTGGGIAFTASTSDFVCSITGTVECSYSVLYDASAVGYRQTNFRRGPAFSPLLLFGDAFSQPYTAVSNYATANAVACIPILTVPTTIRMYVWQSSGGNLNITQAASQGRNTASLRYVTSSGSSSSSTSTRSRVRGILIY